ncbi:MAG: bactofilin family protein [Croceibacterium sp.]
MDDQTEQSEVRRRASANGKARESEAEAVPISVIGPNITITGDIHSTEDLVIEGTVDGSVTCGTLVVGESGCVRGDIRTDRLRLAGVVEGSIETSDLAIEASAHVKGDVNYTRLRVASGGTIQGQMNCHGEDDDRAERPVRAAKVASTPRPVAVFEDSTYHPSREAMRNAAA